MTKQTRHAGHIRFPRKEFPLLNYMVDDDGNYDDDDDDNNNDHVDGVRLRV
jgi:hypothetical protein